MADTHAPLDPLAIPRAPSADLAQRVRAAVAQTPAPRTPLRLRLALALLALPLAVTAGLVGSRLVFANRPALRLDLDELPLVPLAERLGFFLLVATAATVLALAPGRRGLGAKVTQLSAASVLVAPVYTLVSMVGALRTTAGDAAARGLHPLGLPCAAVAGAVGALALAAFGIALRRAVPVATVARSAALGAAAGAWAGVALFLQCPANDPVHLVLGHAVPIAAFAFVGALALPRVLRP